MKKIKKILFILLPIFLWWGSSLIPVAQGDPDPPLACCYVIQLAASQVENCSAKGQFDPVNLQFSTNLAGAQVAVQALEGGALGINGSAAIDQDGNLSFPFQTGDQPGSYRVSVVAQYGNADMPIALLQFQVPNPGVMMT